MPDKIWLGKAGGTVHTYTITIGGTWVATETVSATISQSSVTVTVASGETTTNEVASALSAAINASSVTDSLVGTETRNVGGQQYGEFREVTATVLSNVVTIRANSIGVPFTLTASETSSSGTATPSNTVTATGPMHANNAANWSGAALPVDGDTLVYNQGSVHCRYGLDYFRDNTLKVSFQRTSDYTGDIGLPNDNVGGYVEYRDRFLELYDTLDAKTIKFVQGVSGNVGGRTYLDLQGQTYASFHARELGTAGVLHAHGGTVSDMYLGNGLIVTDPDDADQTAGMTIDALEVGSQRGSVEFGRLTAWATAGTTGTIRSGEVVFHNALDQGTPELALTIKDGNVRLRGDGDLTTVTVEDGTLHWEADGDAAATLNIWGDATLDLRGDGRSKAFGGTINVFDGTTVHKGGHNPTLTPNGCTIEDLTLTA